MTSSIDRVSHLLQVGKRRPGKEEDLSKVTDKARVWMAARVRVRPDLKAWVGGGTGKQALRTGDLENCLLPQLLFSINKLLQRFCLNKSL